MLPYITADNGWDTYSIVEIIIYHLSPDRAVDVFASTIGSKEFDFEAKDLLDRLRRTSHARTLRAHFKQPSEVQVGRRIFV